MFLSSLHLEMLYTEAVNQWQKHVTGMRPMMIKANMISNDAIETYAPDESAFSGEYFTEKLETKRAETARVATKIGFAASPRRWRILWTRSARTVNRAPAST